MNRSLKQQIQKTFPVLYAKALELAIKEDDLLRARAGQSLSGSGVARAAYGIAAGLMAEAFGEDWRSIGGF